jgi:hypothetical protein
MTNRIKHKKKEDPTPESTAHVKTNVDAKTLRNDKATNFPNSKQKVLLQN